MLGSTPKIFCGLAAVSLAVAFQASVRRERPTAAGGIFHLGSETLPEVELSRPACVDPDCPWWVYGNTFGTPTALTVGVVFRTVSSGPISSRMHCFHAGCDGALSMFPDASDNFNVTGDYYCVSAYYGGSTPTEICNQVAPGAHIIHGTDFPFAAGAYLAGGFKTGGDRARDAQLRVHDMRFIYEGLPPPEPTYYFGADTNLNFDPLLYPREDEDEYDFYAGQLGKGLLQCKIQKNGWDILKLPAQVEVPPDKRCQFQFEVVEDMAVKLGSRKEAARRTYGYWFLFGPRARSGDPRRFGRHQARLLFQQVQTYRRWIEGRTLFADIEEPTESAGGAGSSADTWDVCFEPGGVIHSEACDRNRAVLEGFIEYLVWLKARAKDFGVERFDYEPGVYTRPAAWVTYFGVDYVPVVPEPRRRRRRPRLLETQADARPEPPFVLWLSGCATGKGVYDAVQADEIRDRDLMTIVQQTALGGSRAVLWQYHIDKPDFDVTMQRPVDRFAPLSSPVPYNCRCGDPELWRLDITGSCPPLGEVALETLTIPSDGSVVTTSLAYPSSKTFRIEVSGTYRWGLCDSFCCLNESTLERERHGDAEYLTDNCWLTEYDEFSGVDISVFVDGENVDWGPFREDHIYSIDAAGKNAPFSFHINDCAPCYVDNQGSLTVTIYDLGG